YLAAEKERRLALGAVFESTIFPARAPEGHALIRALVGGTRHPDRAELPDAALVAGVRDDLTQLGVVEGEPVFAEVVRPAGGIPQLEVGHARLVAAREEFERKNPKLSLIGAGWSGVSLNALAREAKATATRIAAR
ncbi:MAG: FAD-dependent oxidoreductase, partial [Thermoplasmatota archaeon]